MIAAPAQNTELIPSGFSAAHDESELGTADWPVTSREYLIATASTICPTASVTISGFSPKTPTKIPLTRPTSTPRPTHARIPSTNRSSDPELTPTSRFPPSEITPGVERSMPACMITSIWPRAAIARTVMNGSTNAHEVLLIAFGAMTAETITRAPVASQIGRNRAATTALAVSWPTRPSAREGATRPVCPEALTSSRSPEGRTPRNVPRPGVHSVHVRREVSTVTERAAWQHTPRDALRGGDEAVRTRTPSGKTETEVV